MRRRAQPALLLLLAALATPALGQELSIDSDVTVVEGDAGQTMAVFVVTFMPPITDVTVDYTTSDNTATVADNDYELTSGTLSFGEGESSLEILVPVNGDLVEEPDETFFVQLSNACCEVGIGNATGLGTIENDDVPVVSIGDAMVTEGDAGQVDAVFPVSVSEAITAGPVTVDFATSDGTATTADGDYASASGQLVIPMGAMGAVADIVVKVNGDTSVEADEDFSVDLTSVVGAGVADGQGQGTIVNDDQAFLSIADVTVTEGDAGPVSAVFTVTLSPMSTLPVTVAFDSRDGSATTSDGDYQEAGGVLTFNPGETGQTVVVTVNGDVSVEANEEFFVDLLEPAGATIADGTGRGTIIDDDGATLSIGDVVVRERDSGGRDAALPVTLSKVSALPVSVEYATRDGSATTGDEDYRARSGLLSFAPGETRKTVLVIVLGDSRVEPDESFFVDLSNPSGAALADATGVVTVRDDDVAPGMIRLVEAAGVDEAAGSAVVTVERTGGDDGPAAIDFSTGDGTAGGGVDYQPSAGTLSWADGESGNRTFAVPILDDNLREDDETVVVRLANPSGAALGEPSELELVILDDDAPASLELVGEGRVTARVDRQIELQVLVSREDGAPVRGAPVVWTVEGDAELLAGNPTLTDAEGLAGQQVLLGGSPGTLTITAGIADTDQSVTFEIVAEGDLDELFDPLLSPAESSVAGALNMACFDAGGDFAELCDYLFGLEPSDQRDVIAELTPGEAGALADLLLQSPSAQLLNLRQHLAARRSGGSSGSQFALGLTGESVPLDVLRQAFAGEAEVVRRMAARIDAAMFQRPAEESADELPPEVEGQSRFSFFASGRVDIGDRPGTELEAGFDLETLGLTIGLDYLLRPRLVIGGALGYVDTDTEVDGGGGIDVRGYSLSGFLTWFRDRFWLDGILSYGRTDYDFLRTIDLPQPFQGQSRLAARGRPEGSQLAADLGVGYDTSFGATGLSGFGRLSYIDAEVDGFTEEGAGPFSLALGGQQIESLLLEAGFELVRASSRPWGVLQPVLRVSALHEFEDDSRVVLASFAGDVGNNTFRLPTDRPDRDFFRLGAGLTATLARGRALYVLYETDLEREDLDLYRLTGGLRLEL